MFGISFLVIIDLILLISLLHYGKSDDTVVGLFFFKSPVTKNAALD